MLYEGRHYVNSTELVSELFNVLGESFGWAVEKYRLEKDGRPFRELIMGAFGEKGLELLLQATEENIQETMVELGRLGQEVRAKRGS